VDKWVDPKLFPSSFFVHFVLFTVQLYINLYFSKSEFHTDLESMLNSVVACAEADLSAYVQFFRPTAFHAQNESFFRLTLSAPVY